MAHSLGEAHAEEELNRFCRERLAPCMVPKSYVFMEALPQYTVGKVLRKEFGEM